MMTFRMLCEYVATEPFRPSRIKMASGPFLEVRDPEMILVGRTAVSVFTTSQTDAEYGERWQDVSLMLMETIETMNACLGTAEG